MLMNSCQIRQRAFTPGAVLSIVFLTLLCSPVVWSVSDIMVVVSDIPTEIKKEVNAATGIENRIHRTSIVKQNIDMDGAVAKRATTEPSFNTEIGNNKPADLFSMVLNDLRINGMEINAARVEDQVALNSRKCLR